MWEWCQKFIRHSVILLNLAVIPCLSFKAVVVEIHTHTHTHTCFLGGSDSNESACLCGKPRFDPWVKKILWRREWQPTPVFMPGEFHGQRTLVGYSPWLHRELEMTEQLTLTFHLCVCVCVRACAQLCLTLCNPVDYKPRGSSVHRILQARTLEWVAMPSSRGFSHIYIYSNESFVSCCLLSNLNQKDTLLLCPFLAWVKYAL